MGSHQAGFHVLFTEKERAEGFAHVLARNLYTYNIALHVESTLTPRKKLVTQYVLTWRGIRKEHLTRGLDPRGRQICQRLLVT